VSASGLRGEEDGREEEEGRESALLMTVCCGGGGPVLTHSPPPSPCPLSSLGVWIHTEGKGERTTAEPVRTGHMPILFIKKELKK
jgi:hypothetical protein